MTPFLLVTLFCILFIIPDLISLIFKTEKVDCGFILPPKTSIALIGIVWAMMAIPLLVCHLVYTLL